MWPQQGNTKVYRLIWSGNIMSNVLWYLKEVSGT
jgi:hypothetical protein